jgi:hypothetical protein
MNLESAIARVKELENIITQSAANHNALIGALQEANRIVCAFSPTVETVEKIAEEVIENLPVEDSQE